MQQPNWITELSEADLRFIRAFVVSSGSLKALDRLYGISYPTVRTRLNRIIAKIEQAESEEDDLFIRRLHALAIDKDLPADLVESIALVYQSSKEEMK